MSTTTTTNTETQSTKFSRYRSVRKTIATSSPQDAQAASDKTSSELSRAPSRYRRPSRPQTHNVPLPTQPAPAPAPAPGTLPFVPPERKQSLPSDNPAVKPVSPIRNVTLPISQPSPTQPNADYEFSGGPVRTQQPGNSDMPHLQRQASRPSADLCRSTGVSSPKSYEAARNEALMILEGEYDRLQSIKEAPTRQIPGPVSQPPIPARHLTQRQQPKPEPAYVDAPKLNVKVKVQRHLPEKYHDAPRAIGQKQTSPVLEKPLKPSVPQGVISQAPLASRALVDAPILTAPKQPEPVKLDATPFDAPVSAVNAGDRRVEIKLNNAERGITLPVNPTTNPRDLLNSASIVMSENFDPKTSVVVETFQKLGLERPLRRYEHIRDVMNSWDSDDQNCLTIMIQSECQVTGLELSEAPQEPPSRVMIQMYLSLRPGKWEKRWIILKEDGQVTMSKRENDGEATNICHLSDFDVYTPTHAQRKKVKSPKKICFAVKSQQKSAMFLEGVNYVHFFATNDKQVADRWYNAVQRWRSWYLVHVMGEGTKRPKEPNTMAGNLANKEVHRLTTHSIESVPYQLGSFKPLLDFSDMNFGTSDSTDPETMNKRNGSPRKPSVEVGGRTSYDAGVSGVARRVSRQRGLPPPSFPSKLVNEAATVGLSGFEDTEQGFTGGGLLGRSLTARRSQGAKATGHGLSGVRGKPLVDLTPASDFAEGSLLRKLEASAVTQGDYDVRIDRIKRVEADVRVGEGL